MAPTLLDSFRPMSLLALAIGPTWRPSNPLRRGVSGEHPRHDRRSTDRLGPDDGPDLTSLVFVQRMLSAVLTPERLAAHLLEAMSAPVEVGPVRRAGVATVVGTGLVTSVTARMNLSAAPAVAHEVEVDLDLSADVQISGARVGYTGTASVRLAMHARLRDPLSVLVEVEHVEHGDVSVTLTPTSRSAATVKSLAPVPRIAQGVIADTINDLAAGPMLRAAREVDLRPLLDHAWIEHQRAFTAERDATPMVITHTPGEPAQPHEPI